ncbi:MAG TPA: pyridoxal kinase PdxY [Intrasporangium sp.]|uniref:pyridoxal kinase PdxY n=1 Tax=Intrasporangium sp. TaxID=1925024 RepID=UPI002D787682|nr:pyridoxal kinase PdxY [Intrasporangium sp.]HET7397566.1 pyridoxal kinase PdxY [Intrasporangium sp.]
MRVLSIQSHVAYGHVGNSAAVFPLQRLGHEVYPVHTVTFSNHTGYGATRGPALAAADVAEVIKGVEDRGAFPGIDAVLSGYLGEQAVGEVVLDAVARVKAANPAAIYCCDPVMGDVGRGFFVQPGIPEFLRDDVVPRADIVTPNQFELEFLVGGRVRTQAELVAAAEDVLARGPEVVLVTSALTEDTPPGCVQMACVTGGERWLVTTPLLPIVAKGGGDVTAALFLAHYRQGGARAALSRTAATMYAVLRATAERMSEELLLVQEQEAVAAPDEIFQVLPIGWTAPP